jgi:prephenate dehydratase
MRLADVRRVASHPVALAQCRQFFAAHPALQAVAAADTAGSVRALRDGGLDADAAIASALAARLYGGAILAEGIEDHAANFTRFLVVARAAAGDPPPAPSKLSLTFTTANAPGALYRALGAFADRGLNLTKIESRPLPGRPWDYVFYLDVEGEPRERVEPALKALHALAGDVRVLGWYGAAAVPAPG